MNTYNKVYIKWNKIELELINTVYQTTFNYNETHQWDIFKTEGCIHKVHIVRFTIFLSFCKLVSHLWSKFTSHSPSLPFDWQVKMETITDRVFNLNAFLQCTIENLCQEASLLFSTDFNKPTQWRNKPRTNSNKCLFTVPLTNCRKHALYVQNMQDVPNVPNLHISTTFS